jgi:hypothetical protein
MKIQELPAHDLSHLHPVNETRMLLAQPVFIEESKDLRPVALI